MTDPHDPASPSRPAAAGTGVVDGLDEVRDALEGADDAPVAERVVVFERVNEVLAAELAALDEV